MTLLLYLLYNHGINSGLVPMPGITYSKSTDLIFLLVALLFLALTLHHKKPIGSKISGLEE
jgi:hypothetical protein